MSLQVKKVPNILNFFVLLVVFMTSRSADAQLSKQINCHSKLVSGKTYRLQFQTPYQQTQYQDVNGELNITQIYKCARATCFKAQLKIDALGVDSKIDNAYWKGSNIQFSRYVGKEGTTQVWFGQCLENSIQGEWYFPEDPNSRHSFKVAY